MIIDLSYQCETGAHCQLKRSADGYRIAMLTMNIYPHQHDQTV